MRGKAFPSPSAAAPPPVLTVWVGSASYTFTPSIPSRDINVGRDHGCDIRLDTLDDGRWTSRTDVVLRFVGNRWIAIDTSRNGIYLNGQPVSTAADIHDGQTIAIGDPRYGPRLLLRLGAPAHPPRVSPVSRPPDPPHRETATRPIPSPPQKNTAATDPRRPVATTTAPAVKPAWLLRNGLTADRLSFHVKGHDLLTDVSFHAPPGTLTAIVGPSARRNSALINLLGASYQPSSGRVTADNRDLHGEYEALRSFIAVVPREPLVLRRLTLERALSYAAELRLPPDTTAPARRDAVDQILDELGLTPHRATKVSKLSTALRYRASVAVELLSRPALLVVDAQRADLDAESQQHLMAMLRRISRAGCVVVVATTSVAPLDMCDQVLLLTAAGTAAFVGPPGQLEAALQAERQGRPVRGQTLRSTGRHTESTTTALPPVANRELQSAQLRRHTWLMVRRQVRMLIGRPWSLVVLTILPLAFGGVALMLPGKTGFGRTDPYGPNPHEPLEILIVLTIAAVIIGTVLTIFELVGEQPLFRREQSLGLSTSAYLAAKIMVFSVVAAILAAVLTTVVVVGKGSPMHRGFLFASPAVELYLTVAATTVVSAIIGLALSALASSVKELLPLLVVAILVSLVFCGGLATITDLPGVNQVSWLVPARWGLAGCAAIVDLHRVDPLTSHTVLWTHYLGWWIFDVAILLVIGMGWAGFLRWRLRPPLRDRAASQFRDAD